MMKSTHHKTRHYLNSLCFSFHERRKWKTLWNRYPTICVQTVQCPDVVQSLARCSWSEQNDFPEGILGARLVDRLPDPNRWQISIFTSKLFRFSEWCWRMVFEIWFYDFKKWNSFGTGLLVQGAKNKSPWHTQKGRIKLLIGHLSCM